MDLLWNLEHVRKLSGMIELFQFSINHLNEYFHGLGAHESQSVDEEGRCPTHPGHEGKIEVSFKRIHIIVLFQARIEISKI